MENPQPLYNFAVEDNHNYYVAQSVNSNVFDFALVHNNCGDEAKPKSPVRIKDSELKGVDVHGFKESFVGKHNVSKWDMFKDKIDSKIWLGNKRQDNFIDTGYLLEELLKYF